MTSRDTYRRCRMGAAAENARAWRCQATNQDTLQRGQTSGSRDLIHSPRARARHPQNPSSMHPPGPRRPQMRARRRVPHNDACSLLLFLCVCVLREKTKSCISSITAPSPLTGRGRRVAIAASGCEWQRYRNASIPRKLRPRRARRSTWTRIISQTAGPGPSGTQAPLLGRLTGPSVVCGHQAGLRGSMC